MEHLFGTAEKPTEHEMIVMLTNELYQRNNKFKQLKAENEKLKQSTDVIQLIQGLKAELAPVIGFFNDAPAVTPTIKKRISKKEKLRIEAEQDRLELENHKKMLEQESLNRIKQKKG
ncbi:MAG: hypothetical protein EOO43_21405 [Flavobacterium sp.]|nr:MAG: hypothetical protein EOO43_21405 [Flavobacterium sp.]